MFIDLTIGKENQPHFSFKVSSSRFCIDRILSLKVVSDAYQALYNHVTLIILKLCPLINKVK